MTQTIEQLQAKVAELEERRCEICGYAEHHREHTGCLRNQVSSLKAELREICAAIDDPASDLTLSTVECIKKLKAENEWQPIETAPKETEVFIGRFIDGEFRFGRSEMFYEHANEFEGETWSGWLWSIDDCDESIAECPTHWMPLPKPPAIDAAMLSQGEQK